MRPFFDFLDFDALKKCFFFNFNRLKLKSERKWLRGICMHTSACDHQGLGKDCNL